MRKTVSQAPSDELANTFYVSASGFIKNHESDFIGVENVWKYAHSREVGTVLPESIVNESLRAYREQDADRFIFHFSQPHAPFIHCPGRYGHDGGRGGTQQVWKGLRQGEFDIEQVWGDYQKNLETVLEHVETVIENVEGDIMVTSDHGNAVGEWGIYGHPPYVPIPAIKKVPWVETSGHNKEEYNVQSQGETSPVTETSRENHLRDLGCID